jgi:hypothetical protein
MTAVRNKFAPAVKIRQTEIATIPITKFRKKIQNCWAKNPTRSRILYERTKPASHHKMSL